MCEECRQNPCHPACPNAEQKTLRCVWCEDDVPEYMVHKIGEDLVCEDCEAEYLANRGDNFVEDFVAEHEPEYYLDWWFESFSKEDKTAMVKDIYAKYYYSDFKGEERFSDKIEFALESNIFLTFVKEQLN